MGGWQSASEAGESGGIPAWLDRDLDLLALEYVKDRVQWERAFPRIRFGSLEFEVLLRLHPRQIPSPINVLADRMGAPARAVENAAEKLQRRNLVTISGGTVNRFYRLVELTGPGRQRLQSYLVHAVRRRRVHRWTKTARTRNPISVNSAGTLALALLPAAMLAVSAFLWYRNYPMTTVLILAGIAAFITLLVRWGFWILDNTIDLNL